MKYGDGEIADYYYLYGHKLRRGYPPIESDHVTRQGVSQVKNQALAPIISEPIKPIKPIINAELNVAKRHSPKAFIKSLFLLPSILYFDISFISPQLSFSCTKITESELHEKLELVRDALNRWDEENARVFLKLSKTHINSVHHQAIYASGHSCKIAFDKYLDDCFNSTHHHHRSHP